MTQLSQRPRPNAALYLLIVACFAPDCRAQQPAGQPASVGQTVQQLTGAHTRVVWVQDQSPENRDSIALGRSLRLMGFDSSDALGERVVLSELRNYSKPLLTPDGQRIVFSDRQRRECFVVNWDGTGLRRIGKGFAVEVWQDPDSRQVWVYAGTQVGKNEGFNFKSLRRFRLDTESDSEVVWDSTEFSPDNFQLSANGEFAAGEFPWPHGGTADLRQRTFQKQADGCWASLAPDNSGLCWIFDGPHRNLYLYPRNSATSWIVNLNTAPGTESFEVFHPRWSNHVQFLCMTGPYKVKSPVNRIDGGGPEVEIFIGKFREDFRAVESWGQVTKNRRGDFHPDVWIRGGEDSSIPDPVLQVPDSAPAAQSAWPGDTDGLLFVWENAKAQNIVTETPTAPAQPCRVDAFGKAVFGRFFEMHCTGGYFLSEPVDQTSRLSAAPYNAFTIEATIMASKSRLNGDAGILAFAADSAAPDVGGKNFRLAQNRDQLTFDWVADQANSAASQSVALSTIVAGQPQHLVLTGNAQELVCYLNGRETKRHPLTGSSLKDWNFQGLIFGDRRKSGNGWPGTLEAIAIYRRALTGQEVQRHAEQRMERLRNRRSIERSVIRGTCVQSSSIPDPRTIVPYRRALVVHHYRVDRLLSGTLKDPEILVAEWGILDKSVIESANRRRGETTQLTIEDFNAHPELTSERRIEETDALELPLFYAVPD